MPKNQTSPGTFILRLMRRVYVWATIPSRGRLKDLPVGLKWGGYAMHQQSITALQCIPNRAFSCTISSLWSWKSTRWYSLARPFRASQLKWPLCKVKVTGVGGIGKSIISGILSDTAAATVYRAIPVWMTFNQGQGNISQTIPYCHIDTNSVCLYRVFS